MKRFCFAYQTFCLFFFYILFAIMSLDLKIPNVTWKTRESDVF